MEEQLPTQEEYDAMTPMQKVAWKRKYPGRYPVNPKRWACPDCSMEMQWRARTLHLMRCKNNK